MSAILLVLASEKAAAAQNSILGISFANDPTAKSTSVPMQIALLLTGLTLLPAIVMCVTPFLRITLVLHFLRQALATQTVPSNQILVGLSLFLTLVIMNPVLKEIYTNAWQPMEAGKLTIEQAADEGAKPLKKFLLRFARDKDLQLFIELSRTSRPANPNDLSLGVLVPAYIISELRTGFQIGTVLYLPFLVVDLVVASITLSIGMMQLPPVMISAPFKILLFVLVDGWNLVVGSLIRSFG
ncbi:MAG: flagellar type III secretion system pore protein FliP [Acidobacteriaceae bacterium]|nr:flagellar type III secretion system pore protein FliP [Acidobacteriaceae bacterium]